VVNTRVCPRMFPPTIMDAPTSEMTEPKPAIKAAKRGKRASRHMSGGTRENGYDLPGVPWVSYFSGNGAALHGTYWHNDYGTPKSAGCINLRPQDAKWLFRWTLPEVPYVPGYITVEWPGRTKVIIQD